MIFKTRTFLTISTLMATVAVVLIFSSGFKKSNSENETQIIDHAASIQSVKLPNEVYFAGERVPLENFDTRESLDRELLTTCYRHSSTILIIKRANRYMPMIEKILKENNIPDDFKYMVAAESEFANVVSPAGAVGFWQIMAATGREQGMEITSDVDERYDVEKSTRFACDYLKKSYEKYGNWTLTAASYNGGRGRIDEQLKAQNQKSYYDLLLTEETARFVFRIVAYKLVISNPAAYGFNIPKSELYPEVKYREVRVDAPVTDFTAFAERYGTNYKMLKFLNPWLRRTSLTPARGKSYSIKIPEAGMRNIEMSN